MSFSIVELDALQADRRAAVRQLLDRCRVVDQRPPLDDHALAALVDDEPNIYAFGVIDASSKLLGYAQATPSSQARPTWTIDIAIDPNHRDDHATILDSALGVLLDRVRERGGHAVQWWCHEPTHANCAIAERHGLLPQRRLLEMHVELHAAPEPPPVAMRTFTPGADEPALLEVNNLAFGHHPEQGNWNLDTLAGRFASDWFDPAGLLVHYSADGVMLGFCWTKIHRTPANSLGEIYVVAVRPHAHGRGLGRAITQAGLVSLHQRGIDRVMLFVDGASTAAQRVYQQLGFVVTSTTTALHQTMISSEQESFAR